MGSNIIERIEKLKLLGVYKFFEKETMFFELDKISVNKETMFGDAGNIVDLFS